MIFPVALLVTGSRSLAKDPKAEAWARAILAEVIGTLPPKSLLIHGGAVGPDSWAHWILDGRSKEPGVRLWSYCYHPDGRLSRTAIMDGAAWNVGKTRWHDDDPGPPARNRHMVNVEMPALVGRGYEPRVLALVDSTSRTKGTGHTVGLARKAGYPVDRRVWEVKP